MPRTKRTMGKPASPFRTRKTFSGQETRSQKRPYRTQEERWRDVLIKDARESNTAMLKEVGIVLDPETGRNRIENYTSIYQPEEIKKQIAYVTRMQKEKFQTDDALKERSDLAEEIITAILAKCLSDDFYFYRSNLFGDIRGGYDIVGTDHETGQTEFVIDVTLGKNDPKHPINQEKVKNTYKNNKNGVMVYDGYEEQDNGLYTPTYDLMTPLLSVSLPDRNSKGEDNLANIIDRMSPSFKEPSEEDFQNALYLIQRLMKSLLDIRDIHDTEENRSLFNVPEIQKRAGSLYGMLSLQEKSRWKSVAKEVQYEIGQWRDRVEDLLDRFYEIEDTLAKKAGDIDPKIFWEMT